MADNDAGNSESSAPSIGDTMREVLSEAEAPEARAAADESAGSDSNAASPEEKSAEAPDADPGGEAQGESEDTDPPEDGESEEEGDAAEESGEVTLIDAPDHWPDERKSGFEKLDAEGRDFFLTEHQRMVASDTRKSVDLAGFKRALAPISADIERSGLTPADAMGQLVEIHKGLQSDPERTIRDLAERHKVTLVRRTDPEDEDEADYGESDAVSGLRDEIAGLKDEIRGLRSGPPAPAAPALPNPEGARVITDFKEAKDDSGELEHPHFEAVEKEMVKLAQVDQLDGKVSSLDDLYSRAIYMNDEVRKKITGKNGKPSSAEAKRRKVANAKKAAAGARGSSGSSPKTEGDFKSFGDDLRKDAAESGLLSPAVGGRI